MPPIITDQQRAMLRELLDTEPGELTRSAFDALSPKKKSAFCLAGGTITPDPKPEHCPAPPFTGSRPATASRAEFNRMSAANQAEYCRLGLPLRD